jgi:O-antigen ligase
LKRGRRHARAVGAPAPSRAEALSEGLVWVMVLAVPFLISATGQDPFRLPKLVIGEWIGLASLVPLAFRLRSAGEISMDRILRWPALAALVPLLAVASAGLVWSAHPRSVATALADLAIGVVLVVGWSAGLAPHRLRRLTIGALVVPAPILALLAGLQAHGVHFLEFARAAHTTRLGVTSLAGNPNDLAGFLAMAGVAAAVVAGAPRQGRQGRARRWAALASLAASLYGLAATGTLTALGALGAGLVVAALVLAPTWRTRGLLLAGAAVALSAVLVSPPVRPRVQERIWVLRSGRVNHALTGRLDGWRAAVWMLGEHPVVGVGHGAYEAEFGNAKLALLARGVPFYPRHVFPMFVNAHNDLLEAAAEWGLLGLAALAWAVARLVACARRVGDLAGGGGRAASALAWGSLTAIAVLAMAHFPLRLALTAFPALVLFAWIFAAGRVEAPVRRPSGGPSGKALFWVVLPLTLLALVAQGDRVRDRLRASRILKGVQMVTSRGLEMGGLPAPLLWAHVRLLGEAEELAPGSPSVPIAQGGQYLLLKRPEEAERSFRRALARGSRPEAWFGLGQAQWAAGERDAARDSFLRAVALNPRMRRDLPPIPGLERPEARRPAGAGR